jgi:hypothetical protein
LKIVFQKWTNYKSFPLCPGEVISMNTKIRIVIKRAKETYSYRYESICIPSLIRIYVSVSEICKLATTVSSYRYINMHT